MNRVTVNVRELNESERNSKLKLNRNECRCEFKGLGNRSSFKDNYLSNPSACDYECDKACKIDKYLDIKNFSSEKRLFVKLVLAYEDETLKATENSLVDKKVTCKKIFVIIVLFTLFHL